MQAVERLRERFPLLQSPPSDDICYATQNRQQGVKQIAPSCDVVVVVGSGNSSNSLRLREVALGAGARAAYLVDFAHQIDEAWLLEADTVGVTAGASVPAGLVEDVLDRPAGHGFTDVSGVAATRETTVFALPQELRADIRRSRTRED